MDKLDWFIAEIVRIRRYVQVYIELFTGKEPIDILTNVSSEVFAIVQRSMHDEILISVARLYEGKKNLSQLNLVSPHENILTDDLNKLREETRTLLDKIDIKDYRIKVAHNINDTDKIIKHNIDSETLILLLDTSLRLIIGLKAELKQEQNVSIPVMINEKYEGKGKALISMLSKI